MNESWYRHLQFFHDLQNYKFWELKGDWSSWHKTLLLKEPANTLFNPETLAEHFLKTQTTPLCKHCPADCLDATGHHQCLIFNSGHISRLSLQLQLRLPLLPETPVLSTATGKSFSPLKKKISAVFYSLCHVYDRWLQILHTYFPHGSGEEPHSAKGGVVLICSLDVKKKGGGSF